MWSKYPFYDHVKAMYYYYAIEGGFDVRKTTRKMINRYVILRYFVCNHQGDPETFEVDTLESKSRYKVRVDMHRSRCEAGIKCRVIPRSTQLKIYDVEERHNHQLYSKENMHLSKKTWLYAKSVHI